MKNPNSNSFFITPTNNEEVLSEIKNLKKDKSSGPSSIPVKILKLFQTPLSKPISLIANLSFSTGIFPVNLKTANVILIFKKDDHTSCNNYRPISLLSNISKITDRLIHSRLMTFLNANEILYERQLDIRIQQLMLFQQLLKKLDKVVTREILLVGHSLIYRRPLIL